MHRHGGLGLDIGEPVSELDPSEMEEPIPCGLCGDWIELQNAHPGPGSGVTGCGGKLICRKCAMCAECGGITRGKYVNWDRNGGPLCYDYEPEMNR